MQKEEFNQIKYQNEFKKKNYDRFELVMPKGQKEVIKQRAKAAGQSISEYIISSSMFSPFPAAQLLLRVMYLP